MTETDPNKIAVEFLILADGAQAIGGKLYMLGGAWDTLMVPQLPGPAPVPISVAAGILIPWTMTNRKFKFAIDLANADGEPVGMPEPFELESEVGRPPGAVQGAPQRNVLSVNLLGLEFQAPGTHQFRAYIDGEILNSIRFEVRNAPLMPGSVPPQGT